MNVSVVLFTSHLRFHDHPPLRAALEVVPLFVSDPAVDRPERLAQASEADGGRCRQHIGEPCSAELNPSRQW
ncbi:hypothetical protein [Streptomyces sp. NPDC020681]|uniref:hypothetical protein n=1 Tax=Streptomyces sp. NPDC020681 TaxID=3365083 RepID=UPI0037A3F53C